MLGWLINDAPIVEHGVISTTLIRLCHVLYKMHKDHPKDIIMVDMDTVQQVFKDDDIAKGVDLQRFDSMNPNWTRHNPFPINASEELDDFQLMWTQLKTHTTFEEFAQMHRVSSKNPNIVLVLVSFTTSEEARDLTAAMQGLSITKKVNRQNLIAYLIHEKFLENDRGTHKVVRSSMITHKLNNDKIKFCPKCSLNTTTCSC